MASNNSKYTPEYRKEICQLIISSGRSATSIAEEMGIDKNTVCSWMRDYRTQNQLPTYEEEKGIKRSVREEDAELKRKNKEKELEIQRLKKENARLREERDIIKKMHAHIHATSRMKYEAILENSRDFKVVNMCRYLGVRPQNYYRWKRNRKKAIEKSIAMLPLIWTIEQIFKVGIVSL